MQSAAATATGGSGAMGPRALSDISCELEQVSHARQVLEKRFDARLATLKTFDTIKVQALTRAAQQSRARRAALAERSKAVQQDAKKASLRLAQVLGDSDPGDAGSKSAKAYLAKAKATYKEHVNRFYPEWQENLEKEKLQRLEQLDRAKESLNQRRKLAQIAFGKERKLRSLVAEKEHGIRLLRAQERKELREMDLQRITLENEAKQVAHHKLQAELQLERIQESDTEKPSGPVQLPPQQVQIRANERQDMSTQWHGKEEEVHRPLFDKNPTEANPIRPHPKDGHQSPVPNERPSTPNSASSASERFALEPVSVDSPKSTEIGQSGTPKSESPTSTGSSLPPHWRTSVRSQLRQNRLSNEHSGHASGETGNEEVRPQKAPFELSYSWQSMPRGITLPGIAETREDVGGSPNAPRLARIPSKWMLSVAVNTPSSPTVQVWVRKEYTVREVIKEICQSPVIREALVVNQCTLCLNAQKLEADETVEELGLALLTGTATMDIEPLSSENHSEGQNWEVAHRALVLLIQATQSPANYEELRGSKYGTLGGGIDDTAGARSALTSAMKGEAHSSNLTTVYHLCAAIQDLIKMQCAGLLPVSAFSSGGRIGRLLLGGAMLTSTTVIDVFRTHHQAANDGRANVWDALTRHWEWIVQERILSRDEVAGLFVGSLLPPGESSMETLALNVKAALRELMTKSISIAETTREGAPSPIHDGVADSPTSSIEDIGSSGKLQHVISSRSKFAPTISEPSPPERRNSIEAFVLDSRKTNKASAELEASEFADDDDFDF